MIERRNHWKKNLGKAVQQRHAKKTALIIQLDYIRWQIQNVGLNWIAYDELKQQQREIIAELATL